MVVKNQKSPNCTDSAAELLFHDQCNLQSGLFFFLKGEGKNLKPDTFIRPATNHPVI